MWLSLMLTMVSAAATYGDPYEAYAAGAYDDALRLFLDAQVDHPKDARLAYNVGNTRYRQGDFKGAQEAYAAALATSDDKLRQQVLFNLGNAAFKAQALEEAVKHYEEALKMQPKDEDARHNLALAQKALEEKKKQEQQNKQDEDTEKKQDEQKQDAAQKKPGDGAPDPQKQDQQSPSDPAKNQPSPGDQDGDGVPDKTEQSGKNPTDPKKPDSDGDGLSDGEEDKNKNGQQDPGETSATRADSDGDGVPDGQDPQPLAAQAPGTQDSKPQEGLSREEALRYLNQLGDGRPRIKAVPKQRRPEKDW